MFGYVNPDKPELKMREYEVYRACYCAVCKAIGRNSGQLARLVLSYDLSFLALLLDALDPVPNRILRERCMAHPTRKHAIIAPNPVIDYAADMNVLLAYYNLKDKWADEHDVGAKTASLLIGSAARKSAARWPAQADGIGKQLERLQVLEKAGCDSADEVAEPFAQIMEILFACPLVKDEATRKGLSWLGYNLGRWIYLLDALDDLEHDVKEGSYNPLLLQYGYEGGAVADFRESIRERMAFSLLYPLSEADKALKVLAIEKNAEILDNVVEAGLIRQTDEILAGMRSGRNRKRTRNSH